MSEKKETSAADSVGHFVGHLFGSLRGAMVMTAVHYGHELKLFEALSKAGKVDSEALASSTGLHVCRSSLSSLGLHFCLFVFD